MDESGTTTTVNMDEQGRVTIPKPARKALGIESVAAILELEVEVKEARADE